jgi:hypothetical protein
MMAKNLAGSGQTAHAARSDSAAVVLVTPGRSSWRKERNIRRTRHGTASRAAARRAGIRSSVFNSRRRSAHSLVVVAGGRA